MMPFSYVGETEVIQSCFQSTRIGLTARLGSPAFPVKLFRGFYSSRDPGWQVYSSTLGIKHE